MKQKILTENSMISYLADFSSKNHLPFASSQGNLRYTGRGNIEEAVVDLYEQLQFQNPRIAEQLPAFHEICPQYEEYLQKTDDFMAGLVRNGLFKVDGLTLTEKGFETLEQTVD